jgi:hypothetical protein
MCWRIWQPLGYCELLQTKLRYFGGSVRADINTSGSSTSTSVMAVRPSLAM